MYFIVILIAVVVSLIIFSVWKNQYLKYNLLRLDPLEESKVDISALLNANDKDSTIWLIGDSRIAQWNLAYLKQLNNRIINLGIEGQTSKQTLENFKKHLEHSHPYCVVIEVGINDFKVIGLAEYRAGKIVSDCYSNTVAIIDLCRNSNINVIYMPVFPTGSIELFRRLIWNTGIDKKLSEYNLQMKEYCLKNNVLYFDVVKLFKKIPQKDRESYQNGFLHLSDAGYKYLSQEFIQFYISKHLSDKQNQSH